MNWTISLFTKYASSFFLSQVKFDSNKKGYELERLDDFDKSINEASNRLNYYLQMAEVEREHIRFLKEAKHLMESVKSHKEEP